MFELENSQPIALAQVPAARDRRLPRRRGPASSTATTASTSAAWCGRRCRTSRPTRRSRAPRRSPCRSSRTTSSPGSSATAATSCCRSTTPLMLEREHDQGRDPRALPQHGLLRQQRLRHPGRRRDVLRQDRRRADVHRGRLPRRARAVAVGLRPDQQPRAQPGPLPPGARPARRRRLRHRGRGRRRWRRHVRRCPSGCSTIARARRARRTYYTEALRDYLLNRSNILGDDLRGALHQRCTAAACASTPRSTRSSRRRPRRPATCCPTPRRASTPRSSRSTPKTGAIRAMVGGRGFVPGEREVNMALRAPPDRVEHQAVHPRRGAAGGAQPDDIIDGADAVHARRTRRPDEPFVINGRRRAGRPTRSPQMTWRSINCAYVRLAQIVGLNRVVDTTYRMAAVAVPVPGPAGRATRDADLSRSSASRPAPTR